MSLSQHLKHLGLTGLFMDHHPDFSGIESSKFLHVDRVEQRISLEIGEDGDHVQPYKSLWPDAEFTADHPFLFFIRDKQTGVLLIHGRIAEPIVTSSLLAWDLSLVSFLHQVWEGRLIVKYIHSKVQSKSKDKFSDFHCEVKGSGWLFGLRSEALSSTDLVNYWINCARHHFTIHSSSASYPGIVWLYGLSKA